MLAWLPVTLALAGALDAAQLRPVFRGVIVSVAPYDPGRAAPEPEPAPSRRRRIASVGELAPLPLGALDTRAAPAVVAGTKDEREAPRDPATKARIRERSTMPAGALRRVRACVGRARVRGVHVGGRLVVRVRPGAELEVLESTLADNGPALRCLESALRASPPAAASRLVLIFSAATTLTSLRGLEDRIGAP